MQPSYPKDYDIISGRDLSEMISNVKAKLAEGWALSGQPYAITFRDHDDDLQVIHYQVMINY